jgi:SAM-dependent methyltransferase
MAKNFYGFYFGLLYFLLAQSAFSALISIFFKMDWWWIPIHLFFPFLIVSAFQSSIPSSWFLISFLIMLMLYWSTFKTQVPYYPSRNEVIPFLLEHIPEDKNMQVIDVGCGFAGVLLALANRRPKSQFWGVEIAPLPYFISWLRAKFQKRNVNILFGDYSKLDFSNYDLVFVYLSPVAMPILWQTIRHQMRPGSYIFSYEFMIPGVEPTSIINIGEKKHNLYLWRI